MLQAAVAGAAAELARPCPLSTMSHYPRFGLRVAVLAAPVLIAAVAVGVAVAAAPAAMQEVEI